MVFVNYVEVQSQETQAHTASLCDYAHMFPMRNEWNIGISE